MPATGQRFHLDIRHVLKVATWHVITLLPDGQDSLASLEFDKYNLDLIGLCETRWRDSGEHLAGNYHYVWSGPNNNSGKVGQAGVALAMSRNTRKALISWRPINERMLEARSNTIMENSPSLWHMPPQTLPKTTRRQTSMPFCKTLLAQDRRMTLLSFYLTLMQLSLETLALTGRMLLAPHSSTEPPTTMATASYRSAEAQTCASLTPGFRASKSIIGPGTAMIVSRKKPSITSSSRVDGCDASHSAVYSEAPNLGTPIPSPMRKHTTETEGTSGLKPAPPTRHLAPGGPLNQAAVPV